MTSSITKDHFVGLMAALPIDMAEPKVAVAVSGGPDSMALAYALTQWTTLEAHILSVDHGLRAEAADEIALVERVAKEWGASFQVLKWEHDGAPERLQEEARRARYQLMAEYCQKQEIEHLFLAHHMDDQAETVLFRLAKGSGLDGLSGMRAVQDMDEIRLVRPLLGVSKAALIELCETQGIAYVNDRSNDDDVFARVRLRKSREVLEEEGLSAKRLSVTAQRIERARKALDELSAKAYEDGIVEIDTGRIVFDFQHFAQQPDEIGLRVLMKAIQILCPNRDYAPRMEKLEDLFSDLVAMNDFRKRTLGGVVFERDEAEERIVLSIEKPS